MFCVVYLKHFCQVMWISTQGNCSVQYAYKRQSSLRFILFWPSLRIWALIGQLSAYPAVRLHYSVPLNLASPPICHCTWVIQSLESFSNSSKIKSIFSWSQKLTVYLSPLISRLLRRSSKGSWRSQGTWVWLWSCRTSRLHQAKPSCETLQKFYRKTSSLLLKL